MMDERLSKAQTVVFDVGNVLLAFDIKKVCTLLPEETRTPLTQAMFGPGYPWGAFDLGAESNEAIALRIAKEAGLPHCQDQVLSVLYQFPELMEPLPLVKELPRLKSMGKQIYALTNFPEPSFTYVCQRFPFMTEYFDGHLVSAREKMIKPDKAIFHLLAEKFSLTPEETLYIDDSLPNILSAQSVGFQAWHYTEIP